MQRQTQREQTQTAATDRSCDRLARARLGGIKRKSSERVEERSEESDLAFSYD